MNKYSVLILTVCILIAAMLTSCAGTRQAVVENWLASAEQHAKRDFSGRWYPENTGNYWLPSTGPIILSQTQAKIKGMFGDFEVMGVVNDNEVVLFGLQYGVVYYTWHLTYLPKAATMMGKQCDGYILKRNSYCHNIVIRPENRKAINLIQSEVVVDTVQ